MSSIDDEYQEVMEDMLHGPPIIHVVVTNDNVGNSRCYTFSTDENMAVFLEYIEECGDALDLKSYTFYSSLLDVMYDEEYVFWTKEH